LTFDKDFGELAFRAGLPHTAGIVLLRLCDATPDLLCRRVVAALERLDDWAGLFAVVDAMRIRTHGLP
jgi:predicted nuclease of predicted toxin-antitoxin system